MNVRPPTIFALTLAFSVAAPALASNTPAAAEKKSQIIGKASRVREWSGSLSVEEAVNLALRQNPEVLRAVREVERVHGQVLEVRAQSLPHLGLSSAMGKQAREIVGVNGSQKSWNVSIEVKQVIFAGGQVQSAIQAAKLTRDASYYTLRDTLDRVVAQVRQQFTQVIAAKSLVEVAKESVELAAQQLMDAQHRFEAGTIPRFNVLRAEVELASVKPNLIRAKNDLLIAQLQLAKTLGLEPAPQGKPAFECTGELVVEKRDLSLSDALTLSRARRPSLKYQREQILIEKERIKQALAGFLPRLDATASYKFAGSRDNWQLDDSIEGYFVGVTGSWKIFDGLETSGQVAQAKARLESARLSYEDAVQQTELEVQKAFADLQQFRETIDSQQKNVEQALEALRLAQERLAAGAGTQLEVLDARVALTRARTTELQARADYVRSLAEFDRATATETNYAEGFKDPLSILEKRILKRAPSDFIKP